MSDIGHDHVTGCLHEGVVFDIAGDKCIGAGAGGSIDKVGA